ncbi:hypothetical protein SUZIE_147685 [Sciurus carolinensis]|uniref:ZMYM2-like/QRICH1 C-terminal domain-containing protein n=1 Tax=Sciurus carolinensis TaxID=30640 RepID=A0AA41SZY7_SCICA|nr:hypothetical protein [Sciurus carolinensis]
MADSDILRDCACQHLCSAYSTKLNKFPVFNINDDLNDLCTSAVSPNTTKATRYALNVWRYWCMTNGLKDHTDITKIPAVKLNELLENFYVTVKKSDGSDFLATSLHAIRRGLDRILKNAGVGFSITSSTFSSSTKKLKEKLWVLSKAGMSGARSRNIVYFSLSDEEEMWQAGCLGDDSPITLLSTVVKYNSQYLNMRTLQEHADLMYGDIELLKDPQNQPYFARTDSVKRESRSGSTRVCHGKIYHEHSRGHKQCPYCLLYKYMYIHRPPTQMEAKSPFYLTARKEATDMGSVWYEEQRMGLRSLRGIVPNLAKKDLNAYKKQGIALLTRVGESVKHVTGGYKLRTRPLEFAAIGEYLDTFALKLGTIDRIAQRIIKEEIGAVSGALEAPLWTLCYMLLLSLLPQSVLKKRDQVQAEYEAKLEAVALRKEDRPKVPADVEKCQDRMECFNADLKADMERWQSNKRQDFRQLLMGLADKNIQYYEKVKGGPHTTVVLIARAFHEGPPETQKQRPCSSQVLPFFCLADLS